MHKLLGYSSGCAVKNVYEKLEFCCTATIGARVLPLRKRSHFVECTAQIHYVLKQLLSCLKTHKGKHNTNQK